MRQKLIEQFDKQIYFEIENELNKHLLKNGIMKDELIKYKNKYKSKITEWKKDINNLKLCDSYLSKHIFLKSINFTVEDWKKIRKENHYNELFLEQGINKKLYKLVKIEIYILKKTKEERATYMRE